MARARRGAQRAAGDVATRERLMEAAVHLFARDGFRLVTVRDISRAAGANIAAINYHFGDKLRLYMSVIQAAAQQVRGTIETTMYAGADLGAEEKLRRYVRATFALMFRDDGVKSELQHLFMHELLEPTPASEFLVEHILKPRLRWLGGVVAELLDLDPSDARVQRCVSSIQSQFMFYGFTQMRRILTEAPRTAAEIDAIVEHTLAFSLAGVRAVAPRGRKK